MRKMKIKYDKNYIFYDEKFYTEKMQNDSRGDGRCGKVSVSLAT